VDEKPPLPPKVILKRKINIPFLVNKPQILRQALIITPKQTIKRPQIISPHQEASNFRSAPISNSSITITPIISPIKLKRKSVNLNEVINI